jgi:putative two-component system response regulator
MDPSKDVLAVGAGRPSARRLYVARDVAAAEAIRHTLVDAGFDQFEAVMDGRRALPAVRQFRPDVVLLDEAIDGFDTIAVARLIASRVTPPEFLPVVILADRTRGCGLRDRLADVSNIFLCDPEDDGGLALLARELAGVRERCRVAAEMASRQHAGAKRLEVEAAHHLAMFTQLKDHPGTGHVDRVGDLSARVAGMLGLEPDEVETIRLAAPLHDVGKIGIADEILLKEEALSLEELDVIKTHTSLGASMLAGSTSLLFQVAEEIALYHHENWDGTGYTPGLEGTAIPLVGRIVRVIDTFDALTSARPFAERWHREHALEFIREQAGQSFDPRVVEAFLEAEIGAGQEHELARGAV